MKATTARINAITRCSVTARIRLLRIPPTTTQDTTVQPPPEYIAATDGSLADTGYRLRTDANGFILPPAADGDAAADETVIFLGDSFVESVYVDEAQRFPAAVQTRLRGAGVRARCLNGGYSGATTLHLLLALIAKVGRMPSTTVCLVVPSNDALSLIKAGGFWCMTDQRYAPVVPVAEAAETPAQPIDLTDLTITLNLFVDACKRLRLRLVLATFPHRKAEYLEDPWLRKRFRNAGNYGRFVGWREQVNAVTRAVANRLSLPMVDLDAALSRDTSCFYDDLHMNTQGSARVAELLAAALLQNGNASGIAKAAADT